MYVTPQYNMQTTLNLSTLRLGARGLLNANDATPERADSFITVYL